MTLEAGKQPPTISSLQTKENLELELELTQAKIELTRLQSDMTRVTRSKIAATNLAHVNTQNSSQTAAQALTVPSLATLQTDTAVQEELKSLHCGIQFFWEYLTS